MIFITEVLLHVQTKFVTCFFDSCGSGAAVDFVVDNPRMKNKTAVVAACGPKEDTYGCDAGTALTLRVDDVLKSLRNGTTAQPTNAQILVYLLLDTLAVPSDQPQTVGRVTRVYAPEELADYPATDLSFWNGLETNKQKHIFDII